MKCFEELRNFLTNSFSQDHDHQRNPEEFHPKMRYKKKEKERNAQDVLNKQKNIT